MIIISLVNTHHHGYKFSFFVLRTFKSYSLDKLSNIQLLTKVNMLYSIF